MNNNTSLLPIVKEPQLTQIDADRPANDVALPPSGFLVSPNEPCESLIRVNLSKEHGLQPLPIVPRPIPPQEHVAAPVLPARPLESKDLVLDWLLAPKRKVSFVDRVLARLVQAEAHEPDVWERENYRQAAIVLTLARRGNTEPFLVSSYQMYGVHPDKLHAKIVARRKAYLGKEYSRWYDENDNLRPNMELKPSIPSLRKPVQSTKSDKERAA